MPVTYCDISLEKIGHVYDNAFEIVANELGVMIQQMKHNDSNMTIDVYEASHRLFDKI